MTTAKNSVLGVVIMDVLAVCVKDSEACHCTVLCAKDGLPAAR